MPTVSGLRRPPLLLEALRGANERASPASSFPPLGPIGRPPTGSQRWQGTLGRGILWVPGLIYRREYRRISWKLRADVDRKPV